VMYRIWERLVERMRPATGSSAASEPAIGPI
jgi:hypothetical protein